MALRANEKVLLHGGGSARRDFIHVSDACEATYLLAKIGKAGETYHISTENEVSIAYVMQLICKQLGKNYDDSVSHQPPRLGHDDRYVLDASKVRHLGWKPTVTLEEGLKAYG